MSTYTFYTGTRIAVYARLQELATDDTGHVRGGAEAQNDNTNKYFSG